MHAKWAVHMWHIANTAAVFAGYSFLIIGELSSWNDESVKTDIREEMKMIMWHVIRIHFAFFGIITLITCQ